jgi:hypothetical protein
MTLNVADRRVAFQAVDARDPRRPVARRDVGLPLVERSPQILGDRHIDADVLVQLRAIDIDVNLACTSRIGAEISGDAIVEAHAERDQ